VTPAPSVGAVVGVVQGQSALGKPSSASAEQAVGPSSEAFDGLFLFDNAWNAGGFPPQFVEVDLVDPTRIARVVISPDVTPVHSVGTHRIEVSTDGVTFVPVWTHAGDASLWSALVADFSAAPLEGVLRLRLVSVSSNSWVAWSEIEIQEAIGATGYGCGCPGSAGVVPRLFAVGGAAVPGNASFGLAVRRAYGGSPCVLFIGATDQAWIGSPLPFEPDPAGAPGCYAFAALQVALASRATSGSGPGAGAADFPLPVPAIAALSGLSFYFQALVYDPGARTALPVVFTNAERVQVQ
jgi:hypothetical protein